MHKSYPRPPAGVRFAAGFASTRTFDLLLWPTLVFVYVMVVFRLCGIDQAVAALFADPTGAGFPLRHGFVTEYLLHDTAQGTMKGLLVVLGLAWLASLNGGRLAGIRRPLGYLVLSILLSVGVVDAGKRLTNMDCPWDLQEYGGQRVFHDLFGTRPVGESPGRCFPGGHSSSGFALFALYFLARRRRPRQARRWLLPAVVLGSVFAIDQWLRGAHFPSHDITTAYLCWTVAAVVDALFFGLDPPTPVNANPATVER